MDSCCSIKGLPRQAGDAFFQMLQREAFAHTEEVLGEVAVVAQRLWTSARMMAWVLYKFIVSVHGTHKMPAVDMRSQSELRASAFIMAKRAIYKCMDPNRCVHVVWSMSVYTCGLVKWSHLIRGNQHTHTHSTHKYVAKSLWSGMAHSVWKCN